MRPARGQCATRQGRPAPRAASWPHFECSRRGCYNAPARGHGEIGRRKGLKIPRLERAVPVRVRLPAPAPARRIGAQRQEPSWRAMLNCGRVHLIAAAKEINPQECQEGRDVDGIVPRSPPGLSRRGSPAMKNGSSKARREKLTAEEHRRPWPLGFRRPHRAEVAIDEDAIAYRGSTRLRIEGDLRPSLSNSRREGSADPKARSRATQGEAEYCAVHHHLFQDVYEHGPAK